MKKTILHLLLFFITLLFENSAICQKKWQAYIITKRTYLDGGNLGYLVTSIDKTNELGVYGNFETAAFYDPKSDKYSPEFKDTVAHLYNTLTKKNGKWQNAGYCIFSNTLSEIFFHGQINGDDFVTTTEAPYVRRLNKFTNIYDPVGIEKWDVTGGYVHYRGSILLPWAKQAIIIGAFDIVNNGPSNIALWDVQKNQFTRIGDTTYGYNPGYFVSVDISPTDSTLALIGRDPFTNKLTGPWVLYKNNLSWANGDYPPIIKNANGIVVVDKNHFYIATSNVDSSPKSAAIYELDKANKAWKKVVSLTNKDPNKVANINSLTYGDGSIYFSGVFDSANGKYLNGKYILQYDVKTKNLSPAGVDLPFVMCLSNEQMTYVSYINHNLYGAAQCSLLGVGQVFALVNADGTLALTNTNFTAQNGGNQNILKWDAISSVRFFNIQKSTTGSDFKTIGTTNENLQTSGLQQHVYIDTAIHSAINYYRLQIVKNDGNYIFSDVKLVRNDISNFSASLNQNPVKSVLSLTTIASHDQVGQLSIFTTTGQKVLSSTKFFPTGVSTANLPVPTLPGGLYILKIQAGENQFTLKFIKN